MSEATKLLEECPKCQDDSRLSVEAICEECDGTGTVLTEAGKAVDKVVQRQMLAQAKLKKRNIPAILESLSQTEL